LTFFLLPGQTCGELARFYAHVYNADFCAMSLPQFRNECCIDGGGSTLSLENELEESQAPTAGTKNNVVLVVSLVFSITLMYL
jgi:hypothetical protein